MRSRTSSIIRQTLTDSGFLEVETPRLVKTPIPEPEISHFRTTQCRSTGIADLHLIPSPEVWLKRLLASGSGSIFEIARCYRNADQQGRLHNSEFTMLEAYGVGRSSIGMLELTLDLCRAVGRDRPGEASLSAVPLILPVAKAFRDYASVDLERILPESSSASGGPPKPREERQAFAALKSAAPALRSDNFRDGFHELLVSRVEPQLPFGTVVLKDYPALIPALARPAVDPRFRDRWELYVDGVELCNTYAELTDPVALHSLLVDEAQRSGLPEPPEHPFGGPLPECSGIAMGVDRLIMLAEQIPSISGVILFPDSAILA